MWKRLGQHDDPAWLRWGGQPARGTLVAGARQVGGADLPPTPWNLPADLLDQEIRQLIAAADALLAQHVPGAPAETLEVLRAALAAVFRERLQRIGAGSRDEQAYVEQMRRRLQRMSMDLGASEAELAELRRQLAHYLELGELPAGGAFPAGLAPDAADYQKKLALLARIVEDNIALRSRPVSDLDA